MWKTPVVAKQSFVNKNFTQNDFASFFFFFFKQVYFHGQKLSRHFENTFPTSLFWCCLFWIHNFSANQTSQEAEERGLLFRRPLAVPPDAGDLGSICGSGRSPGEGNGCPLQYSYLENPMDGGAWWATVHGVTESRTWLSDYAATKLVGRRETNRLWISISASGDGGL